MEIRRQFRMYMLSFAFYERAHESFINGTFMQRCYTQTIKLTGFSICMTHKTICLMANSLKQQQSQPTEILYEFEMDFNDFFLPSYFDSIVLMKCLMFTINV